MPWNSASRPGLEDCISADQYSEVMLIYIVLNHITCKSWMLFVFCFSFPMSQPRRVTEWEHAMHRKNFRATKWSRVFQFIFNRSALTGQDKQFDCVKVSLLKLLTSNKGFYVLFSQGWIRTVRYGGWTSSLSPPSPSPPLFLEVGPLKSSYGVWGSAVSSPSGVWGTAPAEIEFRAF